MYGFWPLNSVAKWERFLPLTWGSLGAPHKSVAVWDGVEERFRKRLAMWKRQYIYKEGRITLIRSTLSNMPMYFMSLMHMPIVVRALLCKWSWHFAVERGTLWKHNISRKFGVEGGRWCTREVREGYGVGLWKEIKKEESLLLKKTVFFVGDVDSKGMGSRVLGGREGRKGGGGWNPWFFWPFNDWEVERFLLTLQGKRLVIDLEDRMQWKYTKDGKFFVKSLYDALEPRSAVPEEHELLEAVQARLAVHQLTAPILGNDHNEFRSRENSVRKNLGQSRYGNGTGIFNDLALIVWLWGRFGMGWYGMVWYGMGTCSDYGGGLAGVSKILDGDMLAQFLELTSMQQEAVLALPLGSLEAVTSSSKQTLLSPISVNRVVQLLERVHYALN
ncbi:hypothetical protein CK203_074372 [Vitis vinifera]|uniref:Uncharacterized protein n=1 Tax=Vitis vinifera TaxID=29760 RepID=A0A438EGZ3_VITVI|nr:hypothetical protein CK203_074372 [Vitis vinifera]